MKIYEWNGGNKPPQYTQFVVIVDKLYFTVAYNGTVQAWPESLNLGSSNLWKQVFPFEE